MTKKLWHNGKKNFWAFLLLYVCSARKNWYIRYGRQSDRAGFQPRGNSVPYIWWRPSHHQKKVWVLSFVWLTRQGLKSKLDHLGFSEDNRRLFLAHTHTLYLSSSKVKKRKPRICKKENCNEAVWNDGGPTTTLYVWKNIIGWEKTDSTSTM